MGAAETKTEATSPTSLQDRLGDATLRGDTRAIRALIAEGAKPTALNGKSTVLHLACSRAVFRTDTSYIEALLTAPAVDVNATGSDGCTPMHATLQGALTAPARQQLNIIAAVRMLLRAGASLSVSSTNGKTPLHFIEEFTPAVIDELLLLFSEAVDVTPLLHFRTAGGNTLLWSATSTQVALRLLQIGIPVNARNSAGQNVVFAHSSLDMVCLLVDAGADAAVQDNNGYTVLYALTRLNRSKSHFAVIEALLDAGADPTVGDRRRGIPTPIGVAIDAGDAELGHLLLRRAAHGCIKLQ